MYETSIPGSRQMLINLYKLSQILSLLFNVLRRRSWKWCYDLGSEILAKDNKWCFVLLCVSLVESCNQNPLKPQQGDITINEIYIFQDL